MGREQTQTQRPRQGADARSSRTRAGSGPIGAEARRPGSLPGQLT
jgi:hypothetical protein